MLGQLEKIEKRYREIEEQIAQPEVATDIKKLQQLARERAGIDDLVTKYRRHKETQRSLKETRQMMTEELDEDMSALVKHEIESLETRLKAQTEELKLALLPRDPNDERDIIMEIRAGTGGGEAALFATDLFRMYSHYAQSRNWGVDIINVNETSIGGIKEVIFEITGKGAFSRLKYERGVHRVQRVPTTESSGRIHTSTATVAVLPQAEEVEVNIDSNDLKIDIFHSGGAGGQNVNKVATAVRITHLPTGIVTVCQDERSQPRNKTKAIAVLRARLLDMERRKQESEISAQRRSQVGGGERAEKIRTYNFPDRRITDHRIGFTAHNLEDVLNGRLDDIVAALKDAEKKKQSAS